MFDFDDVKQMPAIAKELGEGYQFKTAYPYMDQYGIATLYWKLRLDHPDGRKWVRPIYQSPGDIYELSEPPHIKDTILKPLYNQHLPAKYPDATVWLVEGEKCADYLNAFFLKNGVSDQNIALTSGSATSADKADLIPLINRRVIIWPDNDEEGKRCAQILAQRLDDLVESIAVIDVDKLELGIKEDCVDWIDHNTTATIDMIKKFPTLLLPVNPGVDIIRMSDVEIRPIDWLWPKRIACGKITVIAGNPGLGKSQITAALAAHVTKGYAWPDTPNVGTQIGSVIILSAEDDPADTIKPRLLAADADINKCFCLEAVHADHGQKRGFDLSQDVERLRQAITQMGDVRLVIIDPVSAYLGQCDSHNNAEMRRLLAPLSLMAADMGAAIVLVTHFNKSTDQDLIGRVIGSMGMIAAARAGYAVLQDEQHPETRYFLPIKNNIGNDKDGFSFTIHTTVVEMGIESSRIVWGSDLVDKTKIVDAENNKPTQANGAGDFLLEQLADGPKLVAEIFVEAEGPGYSKGTLRRAKQRLGILHRKVGMEEGWEWYLQSEPSIHNQAEDDEGDEDITQICDAPSVTPSMPS